MEKTAFVTYSILLSLVRLRLWSVDDISKRNSFPIRKRYMKNDLVLIFTVRAWYLSNWWISGFGKIKSNFNISPLIYPKHIAIRRNGEWLINIGKVISNVFQALKFLGFLQFVKNSDILIPLFFSKITSSHQKHLSYYMLKST